MGTSPSKPEFITESDLSDDDTEKYFSEHQVDNRKSSPTILLDDDMNNSVDAVIKPILEPEGRIRIQDMNNIEEMLDQYEKISLLYLLIDNCKEAEDILEAHIRSRNEHFLQAWASSEQRKNKKWQNKLLEGLAIIQNYKLAYMYDFTKIDLETQFLPRQGHIAQSVQRVRKVLYLIADDLDQRQTAQFLMKMKEKIAHYPNKYGKNLLELYFLYWECRDVNFLSIIRDVLKSMDLEVLADNLNNLTNTIEPEKNGYADLPLNPILERKPITTRDNTNLGPAGSNFSSLRSHSVLSSMVHIDKVAQMEQYSINPENPGLVLIINQREFHTEIDPQYKHLLNENNETYLLSDRVGTDQDRDRLKQLFTSMKFKEIIVHDNLTHIGMLNEIKKARDSINYEGSFIVFILSHGNNGVVYGANSCKVEVEKIQKIMCERNKKLDGKPKILVLQSCQGEQCLKLEEDDDDGHIATDGPKLRSSIDLLVFWATIPGFAAIRNEKNGSWFIQTLCDEIQRCPNLHFLEICTNVCRQIAKKEWKNKSETYIMTPILNSTMTKAFYLPSSS